MLEGEPRLRSIRGLAARGDDPPETSVEVDVVAFDLTGTLGEENPDVFKPVGATGDEHGMHE